MSLREPNPALSREQTTRAVARGAQRLLFDLGFASLLEFPLSNGRRADIAALGPRGEIWILEVKSCWADYSTDQKWSEYLPFCDEFYLAVAPEFPVDKLAPEVGLVVADGFGGAVVRGGERFALAPARRKALLLEFGRLAAGRLWSSALNQGLEPDRGAI